MLIDIAIFDKNFHYRRSGVWSSVGDQPYHAHYSCNPFGQTVLLQPRCSDVSIVADNCTRWDHPSVLIRISGHLYRRFPCTENAYEWIRLVFVRVRLWWVVVVRFYLSFTRYSVGNLVRIHVYLVLYLYNRGFRMPCSRKHPFLCCRHFCNDRQ